MKSFFNSIRPNAVSAGLLERSCLPSALPNRARGRVLGMVLMLILLFVFPSSLVAQKPANINQLKATWVYNFSKFVKWNEAAFPAPAAPFVIGVLGDAPMGIQLAVIARKRKVQGRQLVIKPIPAGGDYTACHLLFVADTIGVVERRNLLRKTHEKHVLVMGEIQGFALQGACVNLLVTPQRQILFELNTEVAKRHDLTFSGQLLEYSKRVRETVN